MDTRYPRASTFSNVKREREVSLLYGAAYRDLVRLHDVSPAVSPRHVATSSRDATLTALAQLAAIRLRSIRAMISLIDGQYQHILAEATPSTSLTTGAPQAEALWYGSASVSRTNGMGENILSVNLESLHLDELPTYVVRDIIDSDTPLHRLGPSGSQPRFYAGAALLSPAGAVVGALCIFDDKPRLEGLSENDTTCFRELTQTIMTYMQSYTIQEKHRRGERFARGLVSFSEGAANLQPLQDDDVHIKSVPFREQSVPDTPSVARGNPFSDKRPQLSRGSTTHETIRIDRQHSTQQMQQDILPMDSEAMFSRAANVMMVSSYLDGVVMLDASVASNNQLRRRHSNSRESATTLEAEAEISSSSRTSCSEAESGANATSDHKRSLDICQVLGYAYSEPAKNDDGTDAAHLTMVEGNLSRMLVDFPHGKIFIFDSDGQALSSTEEPLASDPPSSVSSSSRGKKRTSRGLKHSQSVHAMFPKARSVAFIPFWDFERSRWFAGCFCWSNDPLRLLSASTDLTHFRVFGHLVMRELSRLDSIALQHAKTSFVASLSHELRSPLHGILGTVNFIKDTALDSFQTSMLNSLNACALTLNDTLSHLMDYSEMNGDVQAMMSSRLLKDPRTIRLSAKPLKNRKPFNGVFDLGIVTEEVIEAVFSESSYTSMSGSLSEDQGSQSSFDPQVEATESRKDCYIALDIASGRDWTYSFPIGLWRRIVMNIFGNAIKFTTSGQIQVSLRCHASKEKDKPDTIALIISDSGSGISPQFLANKVFEPFSQENSFTSGTGLGLSIVRQIIETTGGKVEISSEPGTGTKVTVKLALTKQESVPDLSPQRAEYLSLLSRLQGRRICVLRKERNVSTQNPTIAPSLAGLVSSSNIIVSTLKDHLKMDVIETKSWDGHDTDVVIVPEVSFEYLTAIRKRRQKGGRAPVTMFIALDALEAATLRSAPDVQRKESVVEIITQPCGPHKLAFLLNRCLDRYALPEENLPSQASGSSSPLPAILEANLDWHKSLPMNRLVPTTSLPAPKSVPTDSITSVEAEPSTSVEAASPYANDVLIVDDNAINRKLLVAFMRKHNYQYQEAQNGLEALVAYRKDPSRFRAILMDITMPVMDGLTSTRAIREYEKSNALPRCSIFALTGLASATARLDCINAGVDKYLAKPVSFNALRELLVERDNKRRLSLASPPPSTANRANEVNPFDTFANMQLVTPEKRRDQKSVPKMEGPERSEETTAMEDKEQAELATQPEILPEMLKRSSTDTPRVQIKEDGQREGESLETSSPPNAPQSSTDVAETHETLAKDDGR